LHRCGCPPRHPVRGCRLRGGKRTAQRGGDRLRDRLGP
jgi:hypothetical protein